jgi:hypothetical protein
LRKRKSAPFLGLTVLNRVSHSSVETCSLKMSVNKEKTLPESGTSAEDVSRKLDFIIKRLAALEELILKKPEYEGLAGPLRLTRMGLSLYEEPLRMASELKTAEPSAMKPESDHADIKASLILNAREVRVGENLSIRLEMTNTGKAPARLIRIESLIPEGFKLVREPKIYVVEDRHLNMKGRILNPLSNTDVKLSLRPLTKGVFSLKPKIFYLDENGEFRSHEPETITITVKELGISGWIRGPG